MPLALSEVFWYFAIDADHDVSTDTMEFSLDLIAWAEGVSQSPSAAGQARILELYPIADGYTRYWWRTLSGEGNDLPFVQDTKQFVYGRLIDSPQTLYFKWYVEVSV